VLSGLSSAQHKWTLEPPVSADSEGATLVDPVLPQWKVSAYTEEVQIFDEQDRVNPVHPVYTIPERCVTEMKSYFAAKQGF